MQENINIQNKKASFKYHVQKKYVAGMVLTGLQIKSIRSIRAINCEKNTENHVDHGASNAPDFTDLSILKSCI